MKIKNIAPAYWAEVGGAHFTIEMPGSVLSVNISVLRHDNKSDWVLFIGDDQFTLPASMGETAVWVRMVDETRNVLRAAMISLPTD